MLTLTTTTNPPPELAELFSDPEFRMVYYYGGLDHAIDYVEDRGIRLVESYRSGEHDLLF